MSYHIESYHVISYSMKSNQIMWALSWYLFEAFSKSCSHVYETGMKEGPNTFLLPLVDRTFSVAGFGGSWWEREGWGGDPGHTETETFYGPMATSSFSFPWNNASFRLQHSSMDKWIVRANSQPPKPYPNLLFHFSRHLWLLWKDWIG